MISFWSRTRKTLEQLETLIQLAEQVVLALEQTAQASGAEKKRLAVQMLADLARSHGLSPPILLLEEFA